MSHYHTFVAFCLSVGLVFVIVFALLAGQELLVPFVLAVVIWYLMVTLKSAVKRTPWVGSRLPDALAFLIAVGLGAYAVYLIFGMVRHNFQSLINLAPMYQEKLGILVQKGFEALKVEDPPKLSTMFEKFDLVSLATYFGGTVTQIAQNAGMIFVYVMFLLAEHQSFDKKLVALMKDDSSLEGARSLVQRIGSQVQRYVGVKTVISLITALLSLTVLVGVGVDFAQFWALMIFFFNFIPTIGSILATIFPCLLTILQFESWTPFVVVSISLITIQFLVGNFIEPKIMGRTFNLSGLVIIISLTFWAKVWGLVGMFLCVPIMVIVHIILSNFAATEWVAIMLSAEGKVK